MMAATFNGNPRATIISCNSPTNVSEETELVTFYDELSYLVRIIQKQRATGKMETTNTAFTTHQIGMVNI